MDEGYQRKTSLRLRVARRIGRRALDCLPLQRKPDPQRRKRDPLGILTHYFPAFISCCRVSLNDDIRMIYCVGFRSGIGGVRRHSTGVQPLSGADRSRMDLTKQGSSSISASSTTSSVRPQQRGASNTRSVILSRSPTLNSEGESATHLVY